MNLTQLRLPGRHRRPRAVEPLLEQLVQRLTQCLGDDLRVIVLYGSAASGDYHAQQSDLNILVVTAPQAVTRWRSLQSFAAEWLRHDVGLPLFLTAHELREWSRSFPIEFLDIQAHHRIVFGEDVVAALPIDLARLQWQCESELRGKLLRLRQAFIGATRRADVQRLLERSLTSLLPVFRALLRVKGLALPTKRDELIPVLSRAHHISGDVLQDLLYLKHSRKRVSRAQLDAMFARYLAALEQLAAVVDRAAPPAHA